MVQVNREWIVTGESQRRGVDRHVDLNRPVRDASCHAEAVRPRGKCLGARSVARAHEDGRTPLSRGDRRRARRSSGSHHEPPLSFMSAADPVKRGGHTVHVGVIADQPVVFGPERIARPDARADIGFPRDGSFDCLLVWDGNVARPADRRLRGQHCRQRFR